MARQADIRIGISGWTYPPWRGAFYPKGLKQADELAYASRAFRSIEINGTFYGTQRPEAFAHWADATPEDFVFAVKAPRFITHIRRLREIEAPLANFLASGLLRLGPKLGPLLWQFPPNLGFDAERFTDFLGRLPHDTEAAADLARRHDARLKGRCWTRTDAARKLRHAIEIRNESFATPEFIALLRRFRVALVCADTVDWPRLMDLTADFVYCRLHGSKELYRSGYDAAALKLWAARVQAWRSGKPPPDATYAGRGRGSRRHRDVFLYFDNTDKKRAPRDARRLVQLLGP